MVLDKVLVKEPDTDVEVNEILSEVMFTAGCDNEIV
jgi:hypothetical protein